MLTKRKKDQFGIKIDPKLLKAFRDFADKNGTNVSALMRQATIEFMNKSINSVYTEVNQKERRG